MWQSKFIVLSKNILQDDHVDDNTKIVVSQNNYGALAVNQFTKNHIGNKHFDLEMRVSLHRNETYDDQPFQEITCFFNQHYPQLPELAKSHYKFIGWSTTRNGTTPITSSDIVQFSQTDLFGIWISASHMTFDYLTNGGSSLSGDTSTDYFDGFAVGYLPTAVHADKNFAGWYTSANGGTQVTVETIFSQSSMAGITLYAQFSSESWTLANLGSEWEENSSLNPDPSSYAGCYQSFSNWNIDDSTATLTIHLVGYSNFRIYLRCSSESNCDYVYCTVASGGEQVISPEEQYAWEQIAYYESIGGYNIEYPYDYGDGYCYWNVYDENWNQIDGGGYYSAGEIYARVQESNDDTSIYGYSCIDYSGLNGRDCTIDIVYKKDGSVSNGYDRGYLLIPYDQP